LRRKAGRPTTAHCITVDHRITESFTYGRELNRLDNAKGAKATDALLNYETVK